MEGTGIDLKQKSMVQTFSAERTTGSVVILTIYCHNNSNISHCVDLGSGSCFLEAKKTDSENCYKGK
jgi:hypothetical protein